MGEIKEFVRIGRMDRIGNRKSSEFSHPVHPDKFFDLSQEQKRLLFRSRGGTRKHEVNNYSHDCFHLF
jgi:hypothetical protein